LVNDLVPVATATGYSTLLALLGLLLKCGESLIESSYKVMHVVSEMIHLLVIKQKQFLQ
jgi:hypothetical protein